MADDLRESEVIQYQSATPSDKRALSPLSTAFLYWGGAAWISGMMLMWVVIFPLGQTDPEFSEGLDYALSGILVTLLSGAGAAILVLTLKIRKWWWRQPVMVNRVRTAIAGTVYALATLLPTVIETALDPPRLGWPTHLVWSVPLGWTCFLIIPMLAAFWIVTRHDGRK
jgi:hypothetical protein